MTQRELTPAEYIAAPPEMGSDPDSRAGWAADRLRNIAFLPNRYEIADAGAGGAPERADDMVAGRYTGVVNGWPPCSSRYSVAHDWSPSFVSLACIRAKSSQESMDDLVAHLQTAIEVSRGSRWRRLVATDLPGFTIGVTLDDSRTAQQDAPQLPPCSSKRILNLDKQHSNETTQFLSEQLAESKANLDAQDAKLAAFQSHYLGSLPDEEQTNLNLLTGLTSQLDSANQTAARAQQDKSFAESMLAQQVAAWQASQSGHDPETLEEQLSSATAATGGVPGQIYGRLSGCDQGEE